MSGFCPDEWHGTTEIDLQQRAAGEDYWFWIEGVSPPFGRASPIGEQRRQYAIHDEAIAQAKRDGLMLHTLREADQLARLDAAELSLRDPKP